MATRVQDDPKISFPTPMKERPEEVRLGKRLSSRKGDAAPGLIKIDLVFLEEFEEIRDGSPFTHKLQRSR